MFHTFCACTRSDHLQLNLRPLPQQQSAVGQCNMKQFSKKYRLIQKYWGLYYVLCLDKKSFNMFSTRKLNLLER